MTAIEVLRKKQADNETIVIELEKTAGKIYRSILKERGDYDKCRERIKMIKAENKEIQKGIEKLEGENK